MDTQGPHPILAGKQSWLESEVRQFSDVELEQVIYLFNTSSDSPANWT